MQMQAPIPPMMGPPQPAATPASTAMSPPAVPSPNTAPSEQRPGHPSFRRYGSSINQRAGRALTSYQTTCNSCMRSKWQLAPKMSVGNARAVHAGMGSRAARFSSMPRLQARVPKTDRLTLVIILSDLSFQKGMSHGSSSLCAYVVAVVVAVSASLTTISRVSGSVRCRQSGSSLHELCRILDRMRNTCTKEKEELNRKRQGGEVSQRHPAVLALSTVHCPLYIH